MRVFLILLFIAIYAYPKEKKPFPVTNDSLWHQMDAKSLKALLRDGHDMNLPAYEGQPPLHLSLNGGLTLWNPKVAELLMKQRKCRINAVDRNGETPLLVALQHFDTKTANEQERLITLLLNAGADPFVTNGAGANALHIAFAYRAPQSTIRTLIDIGVDVNAVDSAGLTPLFWGVDTLTFGLLVAKGVDLNFKSDDWGTPLHYAMSNFFDHAKVHFLLNNGADPSIADKGGKLPIHRALLWRDEYRHMIANAPDQSRLWGSSASQNNHAKEQLAHTEAIIARLAPDGIFPADYRDPRAVGCWQSVQKGEEFISFDPEGVVTWPGQDKKGEWDIRSEKLTITDGESSTTFDFNIGGDTLFLNGLPVSVAVDNEPHLPGSAVGNFVQYCLNWEDAKIVPATVIEDLSKDTLTSPKGRWSAPHARYNYVEFTGDTAGDIRFRGDKVGTWVIHDSSLLLTDLRGVTYEVNFIVADGVLWIYDEQKAFRFRSKRSGMF